MENQQMTQFDDKQQMTDLLSSEKFLTGTYNAFYCEAATGNVQSCLLSLLNDEHRMQNELFQEMSTRGWYPTEKAEEQKISAAKQKFGKTVTV